MANTSFKQLLEKVRIQFLFDHPFLSVLALSLPNEFRQNSRSLFETEGTRIYIDETRLLEYTPEEVKYLYAHLLLHILLKHPFRANERDFKLWNRSCDIVINLLLHEFENIGQRPHNEALQHKFSDMSVEEVYTLLYEEGNDGDEEEGANEERQDLIENEGESEAAIEELDAIIVQALGSARKSGNVPSTFLHAVDAMIKPAIDLETLLRSYMLESFFDRENDFSKPNRRFIHQGLYLPGYKKRENRLTIYIALDRSMSISNDTFARFLGIIDDIVRISAEFSVTILPFDAKLYTEEIIRIEPDTPLPKVSLHKGNGGTAFEPVAEYLTQHAELQSFVIVLSDGLFKMERALPFMTLFLISSRKTLKRFEQYGDVLYFDL